MSKMEHKERKCDQSNRERQSDPPEPLKPFHGTGVQSHRQTGVVQKCLERLAECDHREFVSLPGQ